MKTGKFLKVIIFGLIAALLCTGVACAAGTADDYLRAEEMLARGEFSQAARAFESLGDYRDSVQCAAYAWVLALGEQGEYDACIQALTAFQGFRDSSQRLIYYKACQSEELERWDEALAGYAAIPTFYDCTDRAMAIPEKRSAAAYRDADLAEQAGDWDLALTMFRALGSYRDSVARAEVLQKKINERDLAEAYAQALSLEEREQWEEALQAFLRLGTYRDSAQRAEQARQAINAIHYARAEALEAQDCLYEARALFLSLGDYADSARRAAAIDAQRADYQGAMTAVQTGNWLEAFERFTALGAYEDSARKAYLASIGTRMPMRYAGKNTAVFTLEGLQGVADFTANTITPARWSSIGDFEENGLALAERDGKKGFVLPDGTEAVPCKYDDVRAWTNGRCTVAIELKTEWKNDRSVTTGLYGLVLPDGTELLEPRFTQLGNAREWKDVPDDPFRGQDVLFVCNAAGAWALAAADGTMLTEECYTEVKPFAEGLAAVRSVENRWGYIDHAGNECIPFVYEDATSFCGGRAAVKRNEYWGFIDSQGIQRAGFIFTQVADYHAGAADVYLDGHGWEIIGPEGEKLYFACEEHLEADALMARGLWREALEAYAQLEGDALAGERRKEAAYYLGQQAWRDQDAAGALEFYLQAQNLWDAQDRAAEARVALGDAALAAGKPREALTLYQQAQINETGKKKAQRLCEVISFAEALQKEYEKADRSQRLGALSAALSGFRAVETDMTHMAAWQVWERDAALAIGGFSDCAERADAVQQLVWAQDYAQAEALEAEDRLYEARALFLSLGDYADSAQRAAAIDAQRADYQGAMLDVQNERWQSARLRFIALGDYADSARKAYLCSIATLNDSSKMRYAGENTAIYTFIDAYGIVNFADNTVSPVLWDSIGDFEPYGFARMTRDGKTGLIDRHGAVLLPAEWDQIEAFDAHGLARAEKNGLYGLIGSDAQVAVEPTYQAIGDFDTFGLAQIRKRNLVGLMNTRCEVVVAPAYTSIDAFDALGWARAVQNGKTGWLRTDGTKPVPCRYDAVGNWIENRCAVRLEKNGKTLYGLVGQDGQEVLAPEWQTLGGLRLETDEDEQPFAGLNLDPFAQGDCLFARRQDGLWLLLHRDGRQLTAKGYLEAGAFADGLAAVKDEQQLVGYVNTAGEEVIPCQYLWADEFSNGLAAAERASGIGYIDTQGKAKTGFIFSRYADFDGTYMLVELPDEGYEILNRQGEKVYFVSEAYAAADALMAAGEWAQAVDAYSAIPDDRLARERIKEAWYRLGEKNTEAANWPMAMTAFHEAADYDDAPLRYSDACVQYGALDDAIDHLDQFPDLPLVVQRLKELYYLRGENKTALRDWQGAIQDFMAAKDYADAADRVLASWYSQAEELLQNRQWEAASQAYRSAVGWNDAAERVLQPFYLAAEEALAAGEWESAHDWFVKAGSYSDAAGRVQEPYYAAAEKALAAEAWEECHDWFVKAGSYSDAAQRTNEPYYAAAEKALAAEAWEDARNWFVKAGSYSDAVQRTNEPYYAAAEKALENKQWEDAHNWFVKAGNYSDAASRVLEPYYKAGQAYAKSKKWNDARKWYKKALGYSDAQTQYDNASLQYAASLTKSKEYKDAYKIYKTLLGNSKAIQAVQKNKNLKKQSDAWRKAGKTLTFGTYEQDTGKAGREAITWRVLKVDGTRALLIADQVLDARAFDENSYSPDPWSSSDIRTWLNGAFLSESFSSAEQPLIRTATVAAHKAPIPSTYYRTGYYSYSGSYVKENPNTNQGSVTSDKVFLLSAAEVNTYAKQIKKLSGATAYAKAQGADGSWMTRTKGQTSGTSAQNDYLRIITSSGGHSYRDITRSGSWGNYTYPKLGVRPAMWVDLSQIP